MVAFIARMLLLAQIAISLGIAWAFVHFEHMQILPAVVLSAAVVLAVRMAITANNFRLAWRFRSETPARLHISLRQACRLFLEEFHSTMLSSSWSMPFRALPLHHADEPRGLPVLLIHGYGCNSGYWHSMSRALKKAGITHYAISLEPIFGDIDSFVPAVRDGVDKLCQASGSDRVIVVAHSMGGLVARAYLCAHGTHRIARVITLGTPHHGTGLAAFGVGLNSAQMQWSSQDFGQHVKGKSPAGSATSDHPSGIINGTPSEWLRQLAARENPAHHALITSIYSHHDNIIAPQTSSHLPGARNIELHGIGHVALGLNPRVQQIVINEILAAGQEKQPCHPAASIGN